MSDCDTAQGSGTIEPTSVAATANKRRFDL
jgi:hypothetical protein